MTSNKICLSMIGFVFIVSSLLLRLLCGHTMSCDQQMMIMILLVFVFFFNHSSYLDSHVIHVLINHRS